MVRIVAVAGDTGSVRAESPEKQPCIHLAYAKPFSEALLDNSKTMAYSLATRWDFKRRQCAKWYINSNVAMATS